MKKMLSLLLSLILVMSTFAPMNCVIASAASQIEVNRATDDLAEMLSEDEKLSAEDKSTVVNRRIILKTDGKNIDTYNSTMSVDMYGYTIVQYENIESASVAFSRFDALGYEPLYDKISVFNEVDEETSDYELDSYSYSKYRDEKYEWGYAMCDIDEAVDYYKYKVNREVVVGVIDSGIQYDINLFKNRVVRSNTDFSVKSSRDEMDDFGHGTQVASTVVMCTPSNVKVQGFKVSNDNKITDSSVLLALSYIKNMSKRPDVINMSFSGTDMDSHIENEINELTAMGVVFVGWVVFIARVEEIVERLFLAPNTTTRTDGCILLFKTTTWDYLAKAFIMCRISRSYAPNGVICSGWIRTIILQIKHLKYFFYRIVKRHGVAYIATIRLIIGGSLRLIVGLEEVGCTFPIARGNVLRYFCATHHAYCHGCCQ